ncbi:hypothetical protein AAG906_004065 [Vitis piasezkii]
MLPVRTIRTRSLLYYQRLCRNFGAKRLCGKCGGLPLHLWSREAFKRIGESCGGFIAVDEETTFFSQLQWACILVRASGKNMPGSLHVVAGNFCWAVSLWWETPPWVSQVVSRSAWHKDEGWEVRDEGGGDAHAGVSVRDFQIGNQSWGSDEQVECGRRHRAAAGVGGRLASAADLDSTVSYMDLSGGVEWAKGPIPVSPVEAGLGDNSLGPLGPTFNKALTSILRRPSSSRALSEPGGAVGLEMELLAVEDVVAGESLPSHLKFTDEALLEEASSGVGGVSSGAEGAMGQIPLRVVRTEDVSVLSGWNEPPWGSIDSVSANELALVPVGSDFASPLEERIDWWSSSCLAKFSRCLGMRMKGRIDQKGQDGVSRKTNLKSSKSSRELKKLEWTKCLALNLEECEARKEARESYKSWKSRELWLKEGDNNTKFFHRMANAHSVCALSNLGKEVPKKGCRKFERFRPISLMGSLYKLLAMVLASRIKKVMEKVISKSQNVFVEGRQILDAVLIANEAVDSRLKSNQGGVLSMEMFSCLLRRAISGGFLSKWRVRGRSGEGILISHLLFADDTLVFCEESHDQLTYLSWFLMWFEACSGLRVNLEKKDLALELGCKVGGPPSCYLGLPLETPFKSKVVWDGVEERLTLIRNTLSSMPIYFMSLFYLPRKSSNGVGDGWTPLFSRAFNDWEIEMVERFMLKIQAFRPGGSPLLPCGGIWRANVPPKVAFFAWGASWGKILTLEQLQRRGYSLANRCFLCLSEVETVDHLLLHCVKTRTLKLSLGGMERLWRKPIKRLGKWPPYVFFGQEGKEFVSFWE